MRFRPTENRIVVKPDPAPEQTAAGLVLSEESRKPPNCGTVVGVGPGLLTLDGGRAPMQIREGDRVVFSPFAGEEVDLLDTGRREDALLVMRESDVQVVLMDKSIGLSAVA